jgi:hypothetical protein
MMPFDYKYMRSHLTTQIFFWGVFLMSSIVFSKWGLLLGWV